MIRTLTLKERMDIAEEFTICDIPLASFFVQEIGKIRLSDLGKIYRRAKKSRFSELCELTKLSKAAADIITVGEFIDLIERIKKDDRETCEHILKIYSLILYHFIYYPMKDFEKGITLNLNDEDYDLYYVISNFVRTDFKTFLNASKVIMEKNGYIYDNITKKYNTIMTKFFSYIERNSKTDVGNVIYNTYNHMESVLENHNSSYLKREVEFVSIVIETIFAAPCIAACYSGKTSIDKLLK